MKIGIIGAGNISDQYLKNLAIYPSTEVISIGDIDTDRAAAQAEKYGIAESGTPDVVLNNPDVELVINLTIPAAHAAVSTAAISAGKHVWTEKPLAMNREEGAALLEHAAANGKLIGCAPDTVLGPGIQTVMRRIAGGDLGRPLTGLALMQQPGPDRWHPNPEFLFQTGGGPVLDIGPYYLTSLVMALGPVTKVAAGGGTARTVRTIGQGPRAGEEFEVTVPTTAQALLTHESGASSVVIMSFDSAKGRIGLEFGGTEATIEATDPNNFDGTYQFYTPGDEAVANETHAEGAGRGAGIVDMIEAIDEGRTHRANGELAYHVLDIMLSIEEAIASGEVVVISSRPPIVEPVADGWTPVGSTA